MLTIAPKKKKKSMRTEEGVDLNSPEKVTKRS